MSLPRAYVTDFVEIWVLELPKDYVTFVTQIYRLSSIIYRLPSIIYRLPSVF